MKIVKILGGLGNQMFQYAFYLSLKRNFSDDIIKVDLSCFNGYPLHCGFELERIFQVNMIQATFMDLLKNGYPYYNYRVRQLGKRILPNRKSIYFESSDAYLDAEVYKDASNKYYDGYWQNIFYFKNAEDLIRRSFAFPMLKDCRNIEIAEQIKSVNSVSIHVRRGDYLNNKLYEGICDIDYYCRGIKYLLESLEDPCFFIFSNDINWCRINLMPYLDKCSFSFINWNQGKDSYIDMQLMSLCKHNIIANSSFSWWGAWLNNNYGKIVISPRKWINIELKSNIQLQEWICF